MANDKRPNGRGEARPGSAAVGVVAALLVVEVAFIGAILTVRREQDLSVQRLATERAFYAAEAGMNMAIAEVMAGEDRDGDGGVGSISDDGDAASDLRLGHATVAVKSMAGPPITLRSEGRSGAARRDVVSTLE